MTAAVALSRTALPEPLGTMVERMGRADELPPNRIVDLTRSDDQWFVGAGVVDVFAVERDAEGRPGLRHFLANVPAPGMLCGFGQAGAAEVEIIAVSRGSTLYSVSASDLAGLAAVPAVQPFIGRLLEMWITGVTAGLARFFAVRSAPVTTLMAGAEAIPPAGNLVVTPRDVVWAFVAEGTARFMGIDEAAVGALLPLTPDSFLAQPPEGGLKVTGYPTTGLLMVPGWWGRMQAFHTGYLRCLAHSIRKEHDIEASRIEKRAAKSADAIGATLGRLVRLVSPWQQAGAAEDPDNALANACAAAAKPLGITIENSALLARRRGEDHPLTVEEVARVSRVRVRQVALRGEWWRQDLGPLVTFSDKDDRPLALVPGGRTGYLLHDPGQGGPPQPLTVQLAMGIQSMAWAFYAPLPDGPLTVADLLKLGIRNQKFDVGVALAAGAVGSIVANTLPVATAAVFQTVIPGHHASQLVQIGLALIIAAFASVIFKITGDIAMLRIEGRIAGTLQAGVLDRLLRLPSSFFNTYSTADLANRTLTVEAVRKALTGLVMSSFMSGIFSLTSLGLLFYYQPMTALVAMLMFILMVGAAAYTGFRQLKALFEGEAISGNIMSLVLQLIGGIQKLRMTGSEDRAWVNWGRNFAEMRTRAQKSRRISNGYAVFMAGYDVLSLALVFLIVTMAAGDKLETGQFLAFVTAFTMFMTSMSQVSRAVMQCFTVTPMISRAKPLLQASPEVDASKADPGRLAGDIEVNGVFFRYDRDSPRVLNGLSVTVKPGQFVALVGPSGCGKSTLMKLLLGFERPEAGGIFYDGLDLRTLDIQAVRRQIGVVLQSGRLMPGTIYENVKGASDATVDGAWEAVRMAGLEEDIRAMPMGMHTVLTEGSAALSGGQVQRLLISRAVVAKPRIIFFDEATSALDNRTQAVVTESLSRLSVTRIAIAHRLSTVKDADRIYVLNEGKAVEAGTYDELMAKDGLFAQLARRQLT
jgi:NHLM bacteriocin system ABC transporter ATP-binding protein